MIYFNVNDKKMKTIEIRNRWNGSLIKSVEVMDGSDLSGANLSGADLRDADLSGAYLRDADLSVSDLSGANLSGAYLRGSDLKGSDLSGAYLRGSDLKGSDLSGANLRDAYLRSLDLSSANIGGADLRDAYLRDANLRGANLRGANLRGADLGGANLGGANLRGANLRGADLGNANLRGADLREIHISESTGFLLSQCPMEGSFIAWKTASKMIVKMQILEDAKRSSATTLKCRCSKSLCLSIENLDGSKSDLTEIASDRDCNFIYRIGEVNEVNDFDENKFNECSSGIHFFISREMAVQYKL